MKNYKKKIFPETTISEIIKFFIIPILIINLQICVMAWYMLFKVPEQVNQPYWHRKDKLKEANIISYVVIK